MFNQQTTTTQTIPAHSGSFTALSQLGLTAAEMTSLKRQGYIQRDPRRAATLGYWRLRFRCQRRLRTVYLGTCDEFVASVRAELAAWQAPYRKRRQLSLNVKNGRRALRQAKRQLAPLMAAIGLHYHGDTLRKSRDVKPDVRIESETNGQSIVVV
jgi:hypothetical protein